MCVWPANPYRPHPAVRPAASYEVFERTCVVGFEDQFLESVVALHSRRHAGALPLTRPSGSPSPQSYTCFVGYVSGVPVTTCSILHLAGEAVASVSDVSTLPAYRRRGLSTRLLTEALTYAAALPSVRYAILTATPLGTCGGLQVRRSRRWKGRLASVVWFHARAGLGACRLLMPVWSSMARDVELTSSPYPSPRARFARV